MDKPLVSVVSLTHNRCSKIINLLDALHTQSYEPKEIILVDNASTDETVETVKRKFPNINLISTTKNLGMVAYNLGFQAAKGKFILVIDDDGLPINNNWIELVIDCFEKNSKLGAVCCKIRMLDTGETALDNPEFSMTGDLQTGFPAASYNGTGAGIRTCVLSEVGFYPEYFFRSFLELHLCSRILNAGWDVKYFPTIEVWHDRPSGSVNRIFTYYGIRNYFLYVWASSPTPYIAAAETLRYVGWLIKCVAKGQVSLILVVRSIANAFLKLDHSIKSRKPVSLTVWRYLFNIRMGTTNNNET
jgi:GT2 family glycosyltransferase